jgi:hypothetical protein
LAGRHAAENMANLPHIALNVLKKTSLKSAASSAKTEKRSQGFIPHFPPWFLMRLPCSKN